MDADLVALGDDPALLVGMQQRGHRRHVEGRLDLRICPAACRMRGTPTRRRTGPRRAGRSTCRLRADRSSRGRCRTTARPRSARRPAIRPAAGCARRAPGRPACANAPRAIARVRDRIPDAFMPSSSSPCCGRRARRRGRGLVGAVRFRTLDPQHPMLMRYQAALRSDRTAPVPGQNHRPVQLMAQPAGLAMAISHV